MGSTLVKKTMSIGIMHIQTFPELTIYWRIPTFLFVSFPFFNYGYV